MLVFAANVIGLLLVCVGWSLKTLFPGENLGLMLSAHHKSAGTYLDQSNVKMFRATEKRPPKGFCSKQRHRRS